MFDENEYEFEDRVVQLIRWRAKKLVGKAGITQSEVSDIEQELAIAVHLAFARYDAEKSGRLTFATHVVNNTTKKILRNRVCEKRNFGNTPHSMNALSDDGSSSIDEDIITPDYADTKPCAFSTVDMKIDVRAVIACLPEELQAIAIQLQTESVSEVARSIGVPRSTVYGAIERIRAVFLQNNFQQYL